MSRFTRPIAIFLAGSALAAAAITCSGPVEHALRGDEELPAPAAAYMDKLPSAATPAFARTEGGTTISDIAERAVQSVVNISSEKVVKTDQMQRGPFFNDPFFERFFGVPPGHGMPRERREQSLGSGVIIGEDGLILTNTHVIENASDVRVTLNDGREVEAEVVGVDPASDVGVLRVKGKHEGLVALPVGDSDALRLGEVVLAIGNPFGVGQTVTMGIVSAKGRANMGIVDYEDFIQTDAAINPGNSGGGLINLSGELVGINTAILSRSGGYQGVGFAIPSNMARSIMDSLVEHGKVVRGWLGVGIQDLNEELAAGLGIDADSGVLISEVMPDSPAQKAGVQRGDVVTKIDGVAVQSSNKLRNIVAASGADETITLDVLRDGKNLTIDVDVGVRPDDPTAAGEVEKSIEPERGAIGGLTVAPLTEEHRRQLRLPPGLDEGLVVTGIERDSPAARAGFRPGDVIRELNRKPVSSADDLERIYDEAKGAVAVLVQRGGRTLYIALRKDHG